MNIMELECTSEYHSSLFGRAAMSLAFVADDGKRTILPLFGPSNQIQTVTFILGSTTVELNNRHHSDGSTSLDVHLRQIQNLQASLASPSTASTHAKVSSDRSFSSHSQYDARAEAHSPSQAAANLRSNNMNKHVKDMRAWIMVLATLFASMTYQAGLNPPGGFWQDDVQPNPVPASYNGTTISNTTSTVPNTIVTGSNTTASLKNVPGHQAGDLILSDKRSTRYSVFFYANTIAFSHSLSIIVYLLMDMISLRKRSVSVLQVIVIIDVLLVLLAYSAGSSRGIGRSFVALQYFSVFIPNSLYEWWKARCCSSGAERDAESGAAEGPVS